MPGWDWDQQTLFQKELKSLCIHLYLEMKCVEASSGIFVNFPRIKKGPLTSFMKEFLLQVFLIFSI